MMDTEHESEHEARAKLAEERREHRLRVWSIAALVVAAVLYLGAYGTAGEVGTLTLGALTVLVPALLDSVRHWRRIR